MDITKKFFIGRIIVHWNGLLRGVVESPLLEVLKARLDMAFSAMV